MIWFGVTVTRRANADARLLFLTRFTRDQCNSLVVLEVIAVQRNLHARHAARARKYFRTDGGTQA